MSPTFIAGHDGRTIGFETEAEADAYRHRSVRPSRRCSESCASTAAKSVACTSEPMMRSHNLTVAVVVPLSPRSNAA
jgi:hypothetical protein